MKDKKARMAAMQVSMWLSRQTTLRKSTVTQKGVATVKLLIKRRKPQKGALVAVKQRESRKGDDMVAESRVLIRGRGRKEKVGRTTRRCCCQLT